MAIVTTPASEYGKPIVLDATEASASRTMTPTIATMTIVVDPFTGSPRNLSVLTTDLLEYGGSRIDRQVRVGLRLHDIQMPQVADHEATVLRNA